MSLPVEYYRALRHFDRKRQELGSKDSFIAYLKANPDALHDYQTVQQAIKENNGNIDPEITPESSLNPIAESNASEPEVNAFNKEVQPLRFAAKNLSGNEAQTAAFLQKKIPKWDFTYDKDNVYAYAPGSKKPVKLDPSLADLGDANWLETMKELGRDVTDAGVDIATEIPASAARAAIIAADVLNPRNIPSTQAEMAAVNAATGAGKEVVRQGLRKLSGNEADWRPVANATVAEGLAGGLFGKLPLESATKRLLNSPALQESVREVVKKLEPTLPTQLVDSLGVKELAPYLQQESRGPLLKAGSAIADYLPKFAATAAGKLSPESYEFLKRNKVPLTGPNEFGDKVTQVGNNLQNVLNISEKNLGNQLAQKDAPNLNSKVKLDEIIKTLKNRLAELNTLEPHEKEAETDLMDQLGVSINYLEDAQKNGGMDLGFLKSKITNLPPNANLPDAIAGAISARSPSRPQALKNILLNPEVNGAGVPTMRTNVKAAMNEVSPGRSLIEKKQSTLKDYAPQFDFTEGSRETPSASKVISYANAGLPEQRAKQTVMQNILGTQTDEKGQLPQDLVQQLLEARNGLRDIRTNMNVNGVDASTMSANTPYQAKWGILRKLLGPGFVKAIPGNAAKLSDITSQNFRTPYDALMREVMKGTPNFGQNGEF